MSFSMTGYDDRFPVISGTCRFCHECHGETRLFMGSIVHIACLRREVNGAGWGYNTPLKKVRRTG